MSNQIELCSHQVYLALSLLMQLTSAVDIQLSQMFTAYPQDKSLLFYGVEQQTTVQQLDLNPLFYTQEFKIYMRVPQQYTQTLPNGTVQTYENYFDNSFAIGIGYENLTLESFALSCSDSCSFSYTQNRPIYVGQTPTSKLQPKQIYTSQKKQYLGSSYQLIYLYKVQGGQPNMLVDIIFTFRPNITFYFPGLDRCQKQYCYSTLKFSPPKNTTAQFLDLDDEKPTSSLDLTLGPEPDFNRSILLVLGNRDQWLNYLLIQAGENDIYIQTWYNISFLDTNKPNLLKAQQGTQITMNYTLQNSWVAILLYTTSDQSSTQIQFFYRTQLRLFAYKLLEMCHGQTFYNNVDCDLKCQEIDAEQNYFTDSVDGFNHLCLQAQYNIWVNFQSQQNDTIVSIAIYNQQSVDYQSFENKTVPILMNNYDLQPYWISILPHGVVSISAYAINQSSYPSRYIKPLTEFYQRYLKLINRGLKCMQSQAYVTYYYLSNGDYCSYACFYNPTTFILSVQVIKYDVFKAVEDKVSSLKKYFFGCYFSTNDDGSQFQFGYLNVGDQTFLYCPSGSMYLFWSKYAMYLALLPQKQTLDLKQSLPQVNIVPCASQSIFVNVWDDIFNNTAWLQFQRPVIIPQIGENNTPNNTVDSTPNSTSNSTANSNAISIADSRGVNSTVNNTNKQIIKKSEVNTKVVNSSVKSVKGQIKSSSSSNQVLSNNKSSTSSISQINQVLSNNKSSTSSISQIVCKNNQSKITWPTCGKMNVCYKSFCGVNKFCQRNFIGIGIIPFTLQLKKNKIIYFKFLPCIFNNSKQSSKSLLTLKSSKPYKTVYLMRQNFIKLISVGVYQDIQISQSTMTQTIYGISSSINTEVTINLTIK